MSFVWNVETLSKTADPTLRIKHHASNKVAIVKDDETGEVLAIITILSKEAMSRLFTNWNTFNAAFEGNESL